MGCAWDNGWCVVQRKMQVGPLPPTVTQLQSMTMRHDMMEERQVHLQVVIQNTSKSNDFANTNDKYLLVEPEYFCICLHAE